ncbi:MAG: DUF58 domain-containing protein [Pirellulales bacterium]
MPAITNRRFLDLRALAALENLRFTTKNRIEGNYGGRHRSRRLGGAGEFVDFRDYSAGEDLRRLDWKVLARTGKAYLRLYQDETNVRGMLVIDASESMRFGATHPRTTAGSKLDYVQHLMTALSYVIARGQDQVGLAVVASRLCEFVPPAGTSSHLQRLYDVIENLPREPARTMAAALRDLRQRFTGRGALILASDFLVADLEQSFAALRLFRHRQSEVVILHVIHLDETVLPSGRAYRFEGMEWPHSVNCSPAEIRDAYARRFEEHCQLVRRLALSAGCDYRRIETSTPYLQTLGTFLAERAG